MRHADKDKDGKLSYIEFVEIITPLSSQIKLVKRSVSPRRSAQPQQQPRSRPESPQISQIRSQRRRSHHPTEPNSAVATPVERVNRASRADRFGTERDSKIFSSSLERLKKYETFPDTMKMSTFSSRSPSRGKSTQRSNRSPVKAKEASRSRGGSGNNSPLRASPTRTPTESLYRRRISVRKSDEQEQEQGPRNSPLRVSTSPQRKERVSTTPEKGSVVGSRRGSLARNRQFVKGGIIIKNGTGKAGAGTPQLESRSASKTPGQIKRQSVVRRRLSPVKRASPVRRESIMRRESSVRRASPLRKSVQFSQVSQVSRAESPVRKLNEREIVMMLKKQIDLIKGLEAQKADLAFRRDFNLMNAFGIFDADRSGSVTKSQFQSGLEALEIFVSPEQLYLLISILDKDTDGLIT